MLCAVAAGLLSSGTPAPDLEAYVLGSMEARKIPGVALAVVRDGKVTKEAVYGYANLEHSVKVKPESVFLLASITKTFTAIAAMSLVHEGKLDLGATLDKFVDGAPDAWKAITVRDLLQHTGGLSDRFEIGSDGRFAMDWTRAQMLAAAKGTNVLQPPGKGWSYSDQGYYLLGLVVEKASGKSYSELIQERIFKPAGMDTATFHSPAQLIPNRVSGYSVLGGGNIVSERRYSFPLVSHFGIMASLKDMERFAIALQEGKLLPPDAMRKLWEPAALSSGDTAAVGSGSYGFGWFVEQFNGMRVVSHGGSTGTAFLHLPDKRFSVIVLTNLEQLAGSNASQIADAAAQMEVPEYSWGEMKPTKNANPVTAKHRAEVESLAKGEMADALYEPAYGKAIRASLRQQKAGLGRLGALKSFEPLGSDELGTLTIYRYRAEYAALPVYFRISLNRAGLIVGFSGVVEEWRL